MPFPGPQHRDFLAFATIYNLRRAAILTAA